jgi:hypothetical protein
LRSYHVTFAEIRMRQKRYQDAEVSIRFAMGIDKQVKDIRKILYEDQKNIAADITTPLYCIYGQYLLDQMNYVKDVKKKNYILSSNAKTMKFVKELPRNDDFNKLHEGTINEVWYQCMKNSEQADPDDDFWLTQVWKNIPNQYLEY